MSRRPLPAIAIVRTSTLNLNVDVRTIAISEIGPAVRGARLDAIGPASEAVEKQPAIIFEPPWVLEARPLKTAGCLAHRSSVASRNRVTPPG